MKPYPRLVHLKLLIPALVYLVQAWLASHPLTAQTPSPNTGQDNGGFQPVDSQITGTPTSALDASQSFSVPPGFKVTQIAAEPAVRQPIAMTQDDRGRLWVAESYSYDGSDFTEEQHDRIVIFEDRDKDGVMESRKIFHDHLGRLTGLVWGFGGVWIASAPHVSFIPDRNGDDKPDGEPEVHLDGWSLKAEHNSVNGLTWGPDGWLYGRHGIKTPSLPGRPGVPLAERKELSCGIWRYHPVDNRFEIVAEGTVNPWGLDFTATGQIFITSSVVNHLWHVVPGSHFERAPITENASGYYELMEPSADHSHRPTGRSTGIGWENDGGGGHSHADVMIYQGGHWPEAYEGQMFLTNIMGRRVNQEHLKTDTQSGRFVATHANDFLRSTDEWFRALGIQYGPDGDVLLSDWCDQGECHDRDGVSRTTGRLYKITWGDPRYVAADLENASDLELVAFQTHPNEWFSRHARRLLQERAAAEKDIHEARLALQDLYAKDEDVVHRLRALWTLHGMDTLSPDWLVEQLKDSDEDIRYWAVRLLVDEGSLSPQYGRALIALAQTEQTWLPRMALASALPLADKTSRFALGQALATRLQAKDDPNITRLIWAGWEPAVAEQPAEALTVFTKLELPQMRCWVSRRMAEMAGQHPELLARLLSVASTRSGWNGTTDLLTGMLEGIPPAEQVNAPDSFRTGLGKLYQETDTTVRLQAMLLGIHFKDRDALYLGREWLGRSDGSLKQRKELIQAIAKAKPEGFEKKLLAMAADSDLGTSAIQALSHFRNPEIPRALLNLYSSLPQAGKSAAVKTLLTRPESAKLLLAGITAGRIAKDAVTPQQVRSLHTSSDQILRQQIEEIWGSLNATPEAIQTRQKELQRIMKDNHFMAAADLGAGHQRFVQRCQSCHTLFEEGGNLGPDLTGANRQDLNYLLMNILDPNAYVLADWRLNLVTLQDGRVLSGSIIAQRDHQLDLKTVEGIVTLDQSSITSIQRMDSSIMPTGLLDDLNAHDIRDLLAYLMTGSAELGTSN